ncbi:MAG: antibiotic biosynthesis monooxygenase family protein [Bacteroidia bacterium]|nr:antibiotic biosynthesis monooxygenase family protein [Bacteroidia bacterium]
MITRMVRMQFRADALAAFEAIFAASKHQIRNFPGCMALELHHDPADPSVRYTWSRWASEEALLAYRQSPIFGQVWPATKALFASPPQAFSMVLEEVIPGSPGQN